jgi:hypothetical protein
MEGDEIKLILGEFTSHGRSFYMVKSESFDNFILILLIINLILSFSLRRYYYTGSPSLI